MNHTRVLKLCSFLLVLLFWSACSRVAGPTVSLQSASSAFWGELESISISQSQLLGDHLLLSTDLGLVQMSFAQDQAQAEYLIHTKDLILIHGLFSSLDASSKKYFYIKDSRLRFFQLSLPANQADPRIKSQGSVSTKKYATLFDGITPGRHTSAPDGSSIYLARYTQLAQFKPGEKAKSTFHMPNFASYMLADQDKFYYRTYERERKSSHIMACVDMQESREVWRKYYGPDHQPWYDIADSFPVLSPQGQLYHIIRAYPDQNFDKQGLFLVEQIDKTNGEVIKSIEIENSKAIGTDVPVGKLIVHEDLLLGEIDVSLSLSLLDLNTGNILWNQAFEAPVLDMLYDAKLNRWVLLMGDASIIALDKLSGEKVMELPPLDFTAHSFSYGQLHITENGDFAGHLNNKEAYTIPRSVFFYRPAP
jgi:hypothetical protein